MKNNAIKYGLIGLAAVSIGLGGCTTSSSSSDSASVSACKLNTSATISEQQKEEVVSNFSDIVYASYNDSLTTAQQLETAIDTLVESPSATNLEAAKTAWLAARKPYGETEGYRFMDGPIDNETGPEGQLNAWPLDENYIDYTIDSQGNRVDQGIVNNTSQDITISVLSSLNEVGSDKNISTGYHAIEFLLWGQDLSDGAGAGERPYTDYVTDGSGTAQNQQRRGQYLKVVTDLLIQDLQGLVNEWAPSQNSNYRKTFEDLNTDEAIQKILVGAGTLSASELSAERMAAPVLSGAEGGKEETHSCFSDNTREDIVRNALSIENILKGTYTKIDGSVVSGTSIYSLVQTVNSTLADKLNTELADTKTKVEAIQNPFDQEILSVEGKARVNAAVDALQLQGATIVDCGCDILGKQISTNLPD